jgi:hypothetical protein
MVMFYAGNKAPPRLTVEPAGYKAPLLFTTPAGYNAPPHDRLLTLTRGLEPEPAIVLIARSTTASPTRFNILLSLAYLTIFYQSLRV